MILSHRYRFIFIKTRKTAGTSIEIALSRFCGADDVITPISYEDEMMRAALGYRGPQNYEFGSDQRLLPIGPATATNVDAAGAEVGRNTWKFFNHIPARLIRERVGPSVWNAYFKFCFVRNPWDTIISNYY